MAAKIVPRWEWRTFGSDFGTAEDALGALEVDRVHESDDLYLLFRDGDATVKVRHGLLDVKRLLAVDDDGLEQWVPVGKHPFPVTRDDLGAALARLGVVASLDRATYTADELLGEVVGATDALRAVMAHKRRTHYDVGGCRAEICEVRTDAGSTRSLAVESEDPARVIATVRSLGLETRANVCMVRGLKALTTFGLVRYAVIDVGTNSVKLHVGERRADDTWRVVIDRATVTRLGEGLDATGALVPEAMDRALEAIAALAEEARDAGAAAIAAVGTAGLRRRRTPPSSSAPPRLAAASGSRSSPARRRAISKRGEPRAGRPSAWRAGSATSSRTTCRSYPSRSSRRMTSSARTDTGR